MENNNMYDIQVIAAGAIRTVTVFMDSSGQIWAQHGFIVLTDKTENEAVARVIHALVHEATQAKVSVKGTGVF